MKISELDENWHDRDLRNRERNVGLEPEDNGMYSIWTMGPKDEKPKKIVTKQCSMDDAERHAHNIKAKHPYLRVWWQAHHLGSKGFEVKENVAETATAGATSSAMGGTLENPAAVTLGKAKGKKSYTGTPGHSGTKAPPQPKVVQPKTADGTAKNGLDIKANIFGQAKESAVIKRR